MTSPSLHPGFAKLAASPLRFKLFLLAKLPAAYFTGLRVKFVTPAAASITVPYKWFTKNPFRSTYFACLAMAGEMASGVLCMANIYGKQPAVSMLVTGMEARFLKKATGITTFDCTDGEAIAAAVAQAMASKDATTVTALSTGKNQNNDTVAEFRITWSFKVKS